MKFFLLVLTVLMLSLKSSKGLRIFDPGDCSMDARLAPVLVACFGQYPTLHGLTDELYNTRSIKEQSNTRKDFFAAGLCALRFARILDENEYMHKDALIAYYDKYLKVEPDCRKELIMSKIDNCFKGYKDKKQNYPVGFCFYIAQVEICAENYASLDGKCKARQ